MNLVKTLVFCLLLTPAFSSVLFSQNSSPAWASGCTDGVEVEIIGKGIQFQGQRSQIAVPDPGTVREIVVEAVCKYACPNQVTFFTNGDTITVGGQPLPYPGSSYIPPARVYRTRLPGGTTINKVSLSGASSYYFMSMTAYLFRQGTSDASASVATFIDKSFWQASETFTLNIPKGNSTRDIEVRIPVTDLNNDPRIAIFSAATASATNTVTVSDFDPNLGASLRIVSVLLTNVAANDTVITITIESPAKNGDSFMVGGAIDVKISCDNSPPIAINDILNTTIDMTAGGNVLTNDFDPDGNPIQVNTTPVISPTNGSLTLNADGSYEYTPASGFTGTDHFNYQVCDNGTPPLCDTGMVTIEVRQNTLANDQPIANDDAFLTFVDAAINSDLLANDGDPDGDDLVINTTPVSGPSNGTLVINNDGTFTYTPASGFEGEDSFVYEVCDDGTPSLCDQATVWIRVIKDPNGNQNDAPIAVDDALVLFEDIPAEGNLSLNDYDPNGNNLTYNNSSVAGPFHGTVTINSDGSFTYTPDAGYIGPDNFIYEVCDDGTPSLCTKATAHLTVMPYNVPPIAVDDINNTFLDQAVMGNVLTNDLDADGDNLTVNTTAVTGPANGSLTLNADGSYTYTPNAGFIGTEVFAYEVCDDGEPGPMCDTAEVVIKVWTSTLDNDQPVANNDNASTLINTSVNGNVLNNDFDPDADPLLVNTTAVSGPSNGTLVLNADGTFTYTPNTGFEGEDVFTYEVCDNGTPPLCDQATVTIRVTKDSNGPENNPPIANDDGFATPEDKEIIADLSPNDSDPNGDNLIYTTSPVDGPFHGTVSINANGTFSYTPDSAYYGSDYFSYEVCDDGTPSLCAMATAYLSVLPQNSAPLAVDDINDAFSGFAVAGNVLANDTDPDNDNLSAGITPISGPANGTLTLNSDGSYTYTSNANFSGTDVFEYEVCDEGIPGPLCDTGKVSIKVRSLTAGNQPPFANDDRAQTRPGIPVSGDMLDNDIDPNGDMLTVNTTAIVRPAHGTIIISVQGTYFYIPFAGFKGEDSFVYEVCDDGNPSLCDQATVTITVMDDPNGSENDPPFAVDDVAFTKIGKPTGGSLIDNDSDPNGDNLIYNTTPVIPAAHGSVTILAGGTFAYTPNAGFFGQDYFVYEVCDDGIPSLCSRASVYILVMPENDPPVALNDINNTLMGLAVDGNVLTNDSDPDGNTLTVSTIAVSGPNNGTLVLNSDGTYTYTPNPGFVGTDRFQYEVCDSGLPGPLCDTAEVTLKVFLVTPGNDPPVANDDLVQTYVNTPKSGNFIINDFDPDGDRLIVNTTPISGPSHGSLVINSRGGFLYFPASGYKGEDSFVYEICDPSGLCDRARVTIFVKEDGNGSANDPPFAGDDAYATEIGQTFGGNLSNNDSDPNGDQLIYNTTAVEGPSHGILTLTASGGFSYTPNPTYAGPDRFVYEVCDNGTPSLCARATAYITVTSENSAPVANPDINLTVAGLATMGNVLTNDYDLEGNALTVNIMPVSGPANGTVVLNADGSYTYTPNTGFSGTDVFYYEVCDNGIPGPLCDTTSVTIDVRQNTNDNDPPFALNDFFVMFVDEVLTGNILSNDGDPDGNAIILNTTLVVNPAHGLALLLGNGSFLYIPMSGFEGEDTFVYEICDNGNPSLCDQATVTIRVIRDPNGTQNDPPFAGDDALVLRQNQLGVGNVLNNDSDPNGNILTVNTRPVVEPNHGTLTLQSNGLYTFVPDSGYAGTDYFVYEVCDNGSPSLCARATGHILVMPDVIPCINVNLGVFLEGPFISSSGTMRTTLNDLGFLPGQIPQTGLFPDTTAAGQPFNESPWFHEGTEGDNIGDMQGGIPYPGTVVDWVLVSLRNGDSLPSSEVWKQAALLHSNGDIQFVGPCFQSNDPGPYWVLVEHRNHVGVMTPQPVAVTQNVQGDYEINFDFRNVNSFAPPLTIGQKLLKASTNTYGMYGGDPQKTGNENFEINGNDNALWLIENGASETYSKADMNLDVEINGADRSIWLPNNGLASGVPK